jgi:hypothetical protein
MKWPPKTVLLEAAGVIGAVAALGVVQNAWVCRPNRDTVIRTMGQLQSGMCRAEVEALLRQTGASGLRHLAADGDSIRLVGQTGVVGWWQMTIMFQNGRLSSARVGTEDGPYHPVGVPADIVTTMQLVEQADSRCETSGRTKR